MASPRQKVIPHQVHLAYDKAKYVYEHPDVITKTIAANELHLKNKVNKGTAHDFLIIFQHLLGGGVFKRALSEYAMDYFLFNIYRDFGSSALQKALVALMLHIVYREEGNSKTGRKPVSQKAMRRVYSKFSNQLIVNNNELKPVYYMMILSKRRYIRKLRIRTRLEMI